MELFWSGKNFWFSMGCSAELRMQARDTQIPKRGVSQRNSIAGRATRSIPQRVNRGQMKVPEKYIVNV